MFRSGTDWRKFIPAIVLLVTDVAVTKNLNVVETEVELDSASFSNISHSLTLYWSDKSKDTAHLEDEDDCIYTGQFENDPDSSVLVTGCSNDFGVQIHSALLGDRMFTLANGSIEYVRISREELQDEYDYYNDYYSEDISVIAEKHGRMKRDYGDDYYYEEDEEYYDSDYDYDNEPEPNPEFESKYPELSGSEFEDVEPPKKLIYSLNVYLDHEFVNKFGGENRAVSEANQILKQVSKIFTHDSLNTKMEIEYGDRIYLSSAKHVNADKWGLATIDQHLQEPYLMENSYRVTHLHLTADIAGKRRSYTKGKAQIRSVCAERPKTIVKYTRDQLRTAATVAHELGHVLGMEHDFRASSDTSEGQPRRDICHGRKKSETIMNYGKNRNYWSDCSNKDFKATYARIVADPDNKSFCLKNPDAKCQCNGATDIIGGECATSTEGGLWCFVDKDSICEDKRDFGDSIISNIACLEGEGCGDDQWQCKGDGKCISLDQRCDAIKKHCSDGSDEADCPFPDDLDDYYYDNFLKL